MQFVVFKFIVTELEFLCDQRNLLKLQVNFGPVIKKNNLKNI